MSLSFRKPQPVPAQQVVAVPQQVQYVATPGIGDMGLLERRQAFLSDRLGRRGGRRLGRQGGLLGL